MTRAEKETHILINLADSDDGYFLFSTTIKTHFDRLCKRIGGEEHLEDFKTDYDRGVAVGWRCRVPMEFLRPNFGIGQKRVVTEEMRERARLHLHSERQNVEGARGK